MTVRGIQIPLYHNKVYLRVGKIPWRKKKRRSKWQPHSTSLAWRIPWTEKPCGLWSMGHKDCYLAQTRKEYPISSFSLPVQSQSYTHARTHACTHTHTDTHTHTKGTCHLSLKLIVQGLHRKQDTEKEASASLVFEGCCFGCWKLLHWPLAKTFLSTESMWPPFKEWSRIWLPVEITGNDLGPLSERWWNFYYNGETSSGHT